LRWLFLLVFADGMLNALYVRPLVEWPVLSWTADVVTHLALPAILLILAVRRHEVRWSDLGFRLRTNDDHGRVVLAVLMLTVPVASIIVYALAIELGRILAPESRMIVRVPSPGVMPADGFWHGVAILYLGISAGFVAELTYRAVLLRILPAGAASSWGYLVLSPVLFGLIHWESGPAMVIATTVFATFMVGLYRSTGTIWPAIAGHVTVDLLWIAIVLGQF
jgi:hypothetical protein